MIRLLEGIKLNVGENQFQYCGIELNLEPLLSKNVLFGGTEVPLKELCTELNENQQKELKTVIDVSVFESLNSTNVLTIAKETIPPVVPYYIKRQLDLRNKLDRIIFKETLRDIFVIKNIQQYELTKLAEPSTSTDREPETRANRVFQPDGQGPTLTGLSSDEMKNQTSRFILLESEMHFDFIVSRVNFQYASPNERPSVHCIDFSEESYFLKKSTQISRVKKYLLNDEAKISQDNFLASSESSHLNIIFDTPGMGKSTLLAKIASQMKMKHPTRNIVFIEMKELVDLLVNTNFEPSVPLIQDVVLKYMSNDDVIGDYIITKLFKQNERQIFLFLDAFDEVNSDFEGIGLNLIQLLTGCQNNFRIYIASRPHKGLDLEETCGSIAYGILPFELSEQIDFLVEYWKNQQTAEHSDEIRLFAEQLLISFHKNVSTEERMITGIPLQCRMLAEIYSEDVQQRSYSLEASKIRFQTINDMYNQYFERKFPGTHLQQSICRSLDTHYKLALDLLFPEFSRNISLWNRFSYKKDLLSFGILEVNRLGIEKFVHRTFAEFLVAKFICNNLLIVGDNFVSLQQIVEFIFEKILVTQFDNFNIMIVPRSHGNEYSFEVAKYSNRGIVFFLGYELSLNKNLDYLPFVNQILIQINFFSDSDVWNSHILACLETNSIGMLTWITSLIKNRVEGGATFRILDESTRLKQKLWNKLKVLKISCLYFQVLIASWYCSPELIKKYFGFVSSIIKQSVSDACFKPEHKFKFNSILPHFLVAMRGNYEVFQLIYSTFKKTDDIDRGIIYNCLSYSHHNSKLIITEKVQIITYILGKMLASDVKRVSLFFVEQIHVKLIMAILSHGVDALQKVRKESTVAHTAAEYLSPDEYEDFVKWLVQNRLECIFKIRNKMQNTPVHHALRYIELTNDTLSILVNKCHVNFNAKDEKGNTEFVYAIRYGRSIQLLKTLVDYGADIKTKDNERHTALCEAVRVSNLEAMEWLLFNHLDPNARCNYFHNVWDHVFEYVPVNADVVRLLLKYKADVNVNIVAPARLACFSPFIRVSESLKSVPLDPESAETLRQISRRSICACPCLLNIAFWPCLCFFCWPCVCYTNFRE